MLFSLPDSHGPYNVGATTFTSAVPAPITIGSARVARGKGKRGAVGSLEPALVLQDHVVFTAYYPCSKRTGGRSVVEGKRMDWLIRPLGGSLDGYAKFAGFSKALLWPIIYLYGAMIKIPVAQNAPLLSPAEPKATPWPLVIFSHGLCGGRTVYSQYCTGLAASGRVVLALEHGDGTAPLAAKWIRDGIRMKSPSNTLYLNEKEVVWDGPGEVDNFKLRQDQLEFRRHEMHLVYSAFTSFINGSGKLESIDGSSIPIDSWYSDPFDPPTVNCRSSVTLAGHSFGGATLFSFLSHETPSKEYPRIPVSEMILLDPWLEPLPEEEDPVPVPPAPGKEEPPIRTFVLNSEGFTLWDSHFHRLQRILRNWNTTEFLTIVKSTHISFSDFMVLPLVRKRPAVTLMNMICDLSLSFLDSDPVANSHDSNTYESPSSCTPGVTPQDKLEIYQTDKTVDYGEGPRKKRAIVGELGDVIVHPVGRAE